MKLKTNIIKRVTAFTIAVTTIFSAITFEDVYANYQSNVLNVSIQNVPTTDTNYSINFSWNNPLSWSAIQDPEAVEADIAAKHPPEGFRIMGLNATARENTYKMVTEIMDPTLLSANILQNLITGSIYSYQVIPFHKHTYINPATNSYYQKDAPMDNTIPPEEVLFMSDIEVEAKGSGNTLNVTWDNPTYKGNNVFTGYRVYYQRGGSNVTTFNTYKDINIDDPKITRINDNMRPGVERLKYSIFDASIVQGEIYAVKVEPLYKGLEIRDLRKGLSYANITIGEKPYRIGFKTQDIKEYRTNDAHISIPLEVMEDGKDFLKLHWWGLSSTIGTIQRIEIYSGPAEDDIGVKIGTIYSPQAVYVNTSKIDKPKDATWYQIKIYVEGKDTPIDSEKCKYDPSIVNITPNKPDLYVNVNSAAAQKELDVYWDVFLRYPYNENEEAFVQPDGTYIDTNVVYDLWIADSIALLEDTGLPKALDRVSPAQLVQTTIPDVSTPVYQTKLTTYGTKDSSGNYLTKNIEENKVYYIKLVAIKPLPDNSDLISEPSYISKYVPAVGNISNPQMLSKPPLRIKKDDSGKEIITKDSITVEWNTKWYEVYDSQTDSWFSKAAIRDANTVVFGKDILKTDIPIDFHNATNEQKVREMFVSSGLSEEKANSLVIRNIDLKDSDVLYEMRVLPFDEVNQEGGYEAYIESILNSDGAGWNQITPTINKINYAEYTATGLDKNETYIIILRPYRMLSDGKKEAYPTYIMGTTLPDDINIEIIPTVPVLEETSHTSISISVKWEEHIPSLDYELVVSDQFLDDPTTGGTRIPIDEIKNNGTEENENNKLYMHYTIKDLFPETGYYIWIRSIANNPSGVAYSKWSNPLFVRTSEIEPPDPPSGLGLVSKNNLNIYNNANNLKLLPIDYNYLIAEWNRNYEDTADTSTTTSTGNGFEALMNPSIKSTYIVKFNNLIANKQYYIRAKTRLTVSKGTTGKSVKSFNYIVQISLTEDFTDYVEAIVPPITGGTTAQGSIQKDSEWCDIVSFYTRPSDGEYDGDKNPNLYPLPPEDFELIYDGATKTLTYRFRSDEEDQDGNDDNLVDQRFISKLLKNKVYNYSVDLTSYNRTREIKNRVVEIPYSIMSAFDERKITFEIKADNAVFLFEPGFVKTQEVEHMAGYGKDASVKINVSEDVKDNSSLSFGQEYVSKPQSLNVSILTPSRIINMDNIEKNVDITLKLDNRHRLYDENIGAYINTPSVGRWERIPYTYDYESGSYKTQTTQLGVFSAIANSGPVTNMTDDMSSNSITNISSKMNITDMQSYSPRAAVSSVQFNNITAALANGKKDAEINGRLSNEDTNALVNSKMYINSTATVTREQAVNSLVRLYEIKTKMPVENYTTLDNTLINDISSASPAYQKSMLKAVTLGFFKDAENSRPKDAISLSELFYMVDIIIQESNM